MPMSNTKRALLKRVRRALPKGTFNTLVMLKHGDYYIVVAKYGYTPDTWFLVDFEDLNPVEHAIKMACSYFGVDYK